MAQTFKSKTLISRTGIFSHEVAAPNLVYNTGNQIISGNKTFVNNIEVQGTGIFNAIDLNNIDNLALSGIDISITGSTVNVYGNILISGNPVLTGVDLSSYATITNLASTGSTLTINLASTGSTLDSKINALSGSLNSSGISLTNTINSLSGSLNSTGINLFTRINNLSGYINSTSSNIVFITGNQNIGGNKTFTGITTFSDAGSFHTIQITNKKLSSYSFNSTNFIFEDNYLNFANSSSNLIGILPSGIVSGINYYAKNLNSGILLISGSGERTIDGFPTLNLYKNESVQLVGVNNPGYTGWITISADGGIS